MVQRIAPRLLTLAFPRRVWSPILNCATSRRMREGIDRERAAELAILDWVVSLCETPETARNMFSVENPVGAASWNQAFIQRLRSAPILSEDLSHLCMFGVKDPRSRRALKRPVRSLTNSPHLLRLVVRKCPNKDHRWHDNSWEEH